MVFVPASKKPPLRRFFGLFQGEDGDFDRLGNITDYEEIKTNLCRGSESNTRRQPLPKLFGLYHLPRREPGANCRIIVGTHLLVSTPSRKLKPFLAWLGIVLFKRVSPEFTRFAIRITAEGPEDFPGLRSTTELPRHLLLLKISKFF